MIRLTVSTHMQYSSSEISLTSSKYLCHIFLSSLPNTCVISFARVFQTPLSYFLLKSYKHLSHIFRSGLPNTPVLSFARVFQTPLSYLFKDLIYYYQEVYLDLLPQPKPQSFGQARYLSTILKNSFAWLSKIKGVP